MSTPERDLETADLVSPRSGQDRNSEPPPVERVEQGREPDGRDGGTRDGEFRDRAAEAGGSPEPDLQRRDPERAPDDREVEARRTGADSAEPADVLFAGEDRKTFEDRWTGVQTTFVDDPQGAVAEADHLVAEVMQTLARRFADHKASLEQQWGTGGEVGTEELRQAMHHYRAFFHRLLGA